MTDKEIAEAQAVAAGQAIPDAPPSPSPLRESRAPGRQAAAEPQAYVPSAEEQGARIAMILLAQQNAAQLERSQRFRPYREAGGESRDLPRVPFRVIPRRSRPDPTRIIDPTTKQAPSSLRQGWVQRWVSMQNQWGEQVESRTSEYEDYGYEYVRDANENVITSRYGVAMQGPPEQYALRALDSTPKGALDRDASLDAADAMAEHMNRLAGQRVADVVVEGDHGQSRYKMPWGSDPAQSE